MCAVRLVARRLVARAVSAEANCGGAQQADWAARAMHARANASSCKFESCTLEHKRSHCSKHSGLVEQCKCSHSGGHSGHSDHCEARLVRVQSVRRAVSGVGAASRGAHLFGSLAREPDALGEVGEGVVH